MKVDVYYQRIDKSGVTPICFGTPVKIKKLFADEIAGHLCSNSWPTINTQPQYAECISHNLLQHPNTLKTTLWFPGKASFCLRQKYCIAVHSYVIMNCYRLLFFTVASYCVESELGCCWWEYFLLHWKLLVSKADKCGRRTLYLPEKT